MTHHGFIDGRPVVFTGEWDDQDDAGYYYRFTGETREHWIRCGNPRLGRVPLFCVGTAHLFENLC